MQRVTNWNQQHSQPRTPVRMRFQHGADVRTETREGQTALSLAQRKRGPFAKIKAMLEEALARQTTASASVVVLIFLVIFLTGSAAIAQPAPQPVRYTIRDLGTF